MPTGEGKATSPAAQSSASMFAKDDGSKRVGKALISVAVTERQRDQVRQYNDDSAAVGSSLDAMDAALDELQSDVRELGRCLKENAFAASQLQKVQQRINGQIKDMLRREKVKMEIKEKKLVSLDKKLRQVQKNQRKIIFGYRCYKYLRIAIILLLIWSVIASIYWGYLENRNED